jgi:hypothetical protein
MMAFSLAPEVDLVSRPERRVQARGLLGPPLRSRRRVEGELRLEVRTEYWHPLRIELTGKRLAERESQEAMVQGANENESSHHSIRPLTIMRRPCLSGK